MAEKYVESILMRLDNMPEAETPLFDDDDCDRLFEFEGVVQLKQIIKSVQNAVHNRHDYVFKIVSIGKLKEED
jgi:hypothetical protein